MTEGDAKQGWRYRIVNEDGSVAAEGPLDCTPGDPPNLVRLAFERPIVVTHGQTLETYRAPPPEQGQ
jgi:hypothetical protein